MPNKKNMEYCSNGKHANFVLPTKTPNKGIFTYLYGKNVENKESKITPHINFIRTNCIERSVKKPH